MRTWFWFWAVVVGCILSAPAIALKSAFRADWYVGANEIIIEGSFIEDVPAPPMSWDLGDPDWLFPTKRGRLLVEKVHRTTPCVGLASGDTLEFVYPASCTGTNENRPGVGRWVEDLSEFSSLSIGQAGLFSFRVVDGIGLSPGAWFQISPAQQAEVRILLSKEGQPQSD